MESLTSSQICIRVEVILPSADISHLSILAINLEPFIGLVGQITFIDGERGWSIAKAN
jgi:hypothetical protein